MNGKIRIGEAETEAEVQFMSRSHDKLRAMFKAEDSGVLVNAIAIVGHPAAIETRGTTYEGYITHVEGLPQNWRVVEIMVS